MNAPVNRDDIANRKYHMRYSFDPIILAAHGDLSGSPEAQEIINSMTPNKTGNATKMLEMRVDVLREAKKLGRPVWISYREAGSNTPISVSELKLISALFCAEDND